MDSSQKKIKIAVEKKQLSESSYENLKEFIENKEMPSWIVESIDFMINNSDDKNIKHKNPHLS